ncbi:MAG: hypothetical protein AB7E47_03695 [Desulfovibrionaceae bacterium]
MDVDFFDAHARHWQDAEILEHASRFANADHLFGFSAECGLKGLMHCFGMRTDASGSPTDSKDKRHANAIWDRFEAYRAGHQTGAAYTLPRSNPFSNWNVDQRYANQRNFDAKLVAKHKSGATSVNNLIEKAKKDGLL